MACVRCHFVELARWSAEAKNPAFSPEIYKALQARALYSDQYAESLLQKILIQFQIACGRQGPWDRETFTGLPIAIPNQSRLYVLLLEKLDSNDAKSKSADLDLYCGQGHGQTKNDSAWKGLPLRLKMYEIQSQAETSKLQAQRRTSGERGKTLHVYMLCSLPDVVHHARVIAILPDEPQEPEAIEDMLYDITIMESNMVLLLGTIMSPKGQAHYDSPIRWMPQSSEWARRTRRTIDALPDPIGYGANRAMPCSQFVTRATLKAYHGTLCNIIKTIFDRCGIVTTTVGGTIKYDDDFVWSSTRHYPTVWHLAQAWVILVYPDETDVLDKRGVQLFWKNHAAKRLLPIWDTLKIVEPPLKLVSALSACAVLSIRDHTVVEIRNHIRDYLISKKLLMLGGGDGNPGIIDRPRLMNGPLRQKSCWAEIHRLFRCSNIPQRVNTADRYVWLFFGEARFVARPLGLRSTAKELNDNPVIAAHDFRSRSATG